MKKQIFGLMLLIGFLFVGCSSSTKKNPTEQKADIYYSNGTEHLIKKNYAEALTKLLESNKLRPKDTKTLNNLGMAFYFQRDVEKAIHFLKMSIVADEKNVDAMNNLAGVFFSQKEYRESELLYRKILKVLTYNQQFRTYYNLGLIAQKFNKTKEAINYLKLSVKQKSDYCPANFSLGELYQKKSQYSSALKSFRKAQLGLCVSHPEPHYQEALTLIQLRETDRARDKLSYIMEKFPTSRYHSLAINKINKLKKTSTLSHTEIMKIQQQYDQRIKKTDQDKKKNNKQTSANVTSPKF